MKRYILTVCCVAMAGLSLQGLAQEISGGNTSSEEAKRFVYAENEVKWKGADIIITPNGSEEVLQPLCFDIISEGVVRLVSPVEYVFEEGVDKEGGYYAGTLTVPEKISTDAGNMQVTEVGGLYLNGVRELTLPSGLRSLSNSIDNCRLLTKVVLNDDLEEITGIRHCHYLEECMLPKGLKRVGDESMMGLAIREILLPEGVKSVGKDAFSYNYMVERLDLGQIEEIGAGAFSHLQSLKSLKIPESVVKVEEGSFSYCCALEELDLPSHPVDFGGECFIENTGLVRMIVRADEPYICPIEWDLMIDITLYVPDGSVNDYKSIVSWSRAKEILPLSALNKAD